MVPAVTCDPEATIRELIEIFTSKKTLSVCVVEDEKLVGLVSVSDFRPKERLFPLTPLRVNFLLGQYYERASSEEQHRQVLQVKVSKAMTTKLVKVTLSTPLKEIEELMKRRDINQVPVVDASGKLLGIVSVFELMAIGL